MPMSMQNRNFIRSSLFHFPSYCQSNAISRANSQNQSFKYTMAEPAPTVVRAVLSGSHKVGKSCLLIRQAQNKFVKDYIYNIGIDLKTNMYQVGQVTIKGQFWDWSRTTAEILASNNHNFYRNAQVVGFCFAINDKESLYSLHKMIEDIRPINKEAKMFLIGCKGDLAPEISEEEVLEYAQENHLTFFCTSSLQNWGVNEVFLEMMKQGLHVKLAQQSQQLSVNKEKVTLIPLKPSCRPKCQIM